MDRDQPLGGGHFRPVADPADMSGIAQRDRGQAGLLAFLDADPDRLRRDGLSVAEFAVDHRQRRCIDHKLDGLVGTAEPIFFHPYRRAPEFTPWLSCPVRLAVVR